jgi:integrase/recombinase XerD
MDFQELLDEYVAWLELQGKSQQTIKTYLWALKKFFEQLPADANPESLSKNDILRTLAKLKKAKNYDKNTIRLIIRALSSFYKFLDRKDVQEILKAPKIDRSLPKFLTYDEIQRLVNAADNPRDRVIVTLLFTAGLRVSELCKLAWKDILWSEGFIRVEKGKGGKDRYVPLHPWAAKELKIYQEWLKAHGINFSEDSRVLVALQSFTKRPTNKSLTPRSVQRILKNLANKAGLQKRVTPHVLRHSLATYLLSKGVDIRFIQELLGHASLATTQIYTHVTPSLLKQAYLRAMKLEEEGKER